MQGPDRELRARARRSPSCIAKLREGAKIERLVDARRRRAAAASYRCAAAAAHAEAVSDLPRRREAGNAVAALAYRHAASPDVHDATHRFSARPANVPDMPAIEGVRLATAAAGIRYQGRTDVLLAVLRPGHGGRRRLHPLEVPLGAGRMVPRPAQGARKARALVVNSGNANAFTGKTGRDACQFTAELAAKAVGCRPGEVFLASTGVIGEPLDASVFDGVMEGLVARQSRRPAGSTRRRRS